MSLTDLALIASILSSAAVAASLLYLALQVHQNTKHARAQIQAGRIDRLVNQMIGFSDADKCDAYLKGNGEEPTPEAIAARQFTMQCTAQFGVMMDIYTQYHDGLLSEEQFQAPRVTYRAWLREPGFRAEWDAWSALVAAEAPEFTGFVNDLIREGEALTSR